MQGETPTQEQRYIYSCKFDLYKMYQMNRGCVNFNLACLILSQVGVLYIYITLLLVFVMGAPNLYHYNMQASVFNYHMTNNNNIFYQNKQCPHNIN